MKKFTLIIIAAAALIMFNSCGSNGTLNKIDKMHEKWQKGDLKTSKLSESDIDDLLEMYNDLIPYFEDAVKEAKTDKTKLDLCEDLAKGFEQLEDILDDIDRDDMTKSQKKWYREMSSDVIDIAWKYMDLQKDDDDDEDDDDEDDDDDLAESISEESVVEEEIPVEEEEAW